MGGLLPDLIQWATDVAYSFGYVGIAILTALGNLHLPIPTEITLPLAGFLVAQGRFSFIAALTWTTAAAVVSSLILSRSDSYTNTNRPNLLTNWRRCSSLSKRPGTYKASYLFKRRGWKAILIGRLIPGVGTLISVPAGLYRMPILGWFMFFTVLDSVVWNAMFIGLGWWIGSQWMLVERYARIVEYGVLVAVAGGLLWFLWRRWKARKRTERWR